MPNDARLNVAVVGTGISGLSAAWLLSQRHSVTLYERADRIGGHSNTILASVGKDSIPVDTGFIVFNRKTYPNLTALFEFLKVAGLMVQKIQDEMGIPLTDVKKFNVKGKVLVYKKDGEVVSKGPDAAPATPATTPATDATTAPAADAAATDAEAARKRAAQSAPQ